MWRKTLSVLLAAILVLSICLVPALADESPSWEIDSKILVKLSEDISVDDWYGNGENRALLAAIAMAEMLWSEACDATEETMTFAATEGAIYVARDGESLTVWFFGENELVYVVYAASSDTMAAAMASLGYSAAEYTMSALRDKGNFASYIEVSQSEFAQALSNLADALAE